MKDATTALITLLKADAALSNSVGARVYRDRVPTPTPNYPFLTVTWISDLRDKANSTGRYSKTRRQVTVFSKPSAPDGSEAARISNLVADALTGKEGTVHAGVYLVDVDDAGAIPDNSDAIGFGIYRVNHDFMITYSFV